MTQDPSQIPPNDELAMPKELRAAGVSRDDLVTLAFRLLGAYLLFQGFLSVISVVVRAIDWRGFSWEITASAVVALAFYVLVGAVLWFLAPKLGGRFLPPQSVPQVPPLAMSAVDLLAAGLAFLGVLIVSVWGVPSLIFDVFRLFEQIEASGAPVYTDTKALVLRDAVEIVIGVWLFSRSKQLASRWARSSVVETTDSEPL